MIDNEDCVRKSLQCMLCTLCLNGRTCIRMYMYMYVYVHTYMYLYVHVHICVCIHVHVHVCVCTCCLPQTISQLEADEVVTDFRHSTMSKEYTVFALSLYLTLHIMCAYLNYWNYPFASTRYSVTHEVCVFWSLEPSFC